MTVERLELRPALATVPIAVGARPTNANQFTDISFWRQNGFSPRITVLDFDGDGALTIDSPAGGSTGPEVWGIVNGKIRLLASTRARPIVVAAATRGYSEETEDIGVATALYVAGTVTGGNATVSFIPCESGSAS